MLPLLATDAGSRSRSQTGIASHRRRFGDWDGGFWLPECAHAAWLRSRLEAAGVRATCVELTGRLGLGDADTAAAGHRGRARCCGRSTGRRSRSCGASAGIRRESAYRDYHRHTTFRHQAWRNDGAPYEHEAALEQARGDAADFVAAVRDRVADGGVCVCALDTELLGHWWYEGVAWLRGRARARPAVRASR